MALRQTWHQYRATIVAACVVLVILVCAIVWLLVSHSFASSASQLVARIHDGDGKTYELPLSQNQTLNVSSSLGNNVVEVSSGTVLMRDADCPNKNCVHQKAISKPGEQIICLPHKLWIEVAQADSTDSSEMDINAVIDETAESSSSNEPDFIAG